MTICLAILSFCARNAFASLMSVDPGAEGTFVTNTGATILDDFPPGIVSGTVDDPDARAMQSAAYICTGFASSAQLAGTLNLDASGNPNAAFLFQIASTLRTAGDSRTTTAPEPGIATLFSVALFLGLGGRQWKLPTTNRSAR
jgi:hypothetical protein